MEVVRVVALWVFGLLASGIFGGMLGSRSAVNTLTTGCGDSWVDCSRSRASAYGSAGLGAKAFRRLTLISRQRRRPGAL